MQQRLAGGYPVSPSALEDDFKSKFKEPMARPFKTFVLSVCYLFLFSWSGCATEPGSGAPIAGASIEFTYNRGEVRVLVTVEATSLFAAAVLFDVNPETGQVEQATTLEDGVSVSWPEALNLTLVGCSATPTLVASQVYSTVKTFNYVIPETCLPSSVTGTATLTVSKTGEADKVLNGTSDSEGTYHTIFVTSTTSTGLIGGGGLIGADSICAARAAAGAVTSGLSGTWRAVLSTSLVDAVDRITFTGGAGLKNTVGESVVETASSLWGGTLLNAIRYDEDGADQGGSPVVSVFSGSDSDGTYTGGSPDADSCTDWTSNLGSQQGSRGNLSQTDFDWLGQGASNCNTVPGRLYCVNSVD